MPDITLLPLIITTIARVRRNTDRDEGVSTLEMLIITLGLIAVAGLLVAAITNAVTSRTDQIK